MEIKTIEDGWGCVPKLTDVTQELDTLSSYVYEIKNCVRQSDLSSMVEDMKEIMDNVKYHLDMIDTTKEYKTVDCSNCDEMVLYGDEECPDCGRDSFTQ
tara:strand:+ start:129 stop:425 length:297 start_codon:yes stop_codon:yes gene_type:complete